MKKQLLKKIYAVVILMMFSVSANAQIIYTDLDPDVTIDRESGGAPLTYSIDLNNDGIFDVTLSTYRVFSSIFRPNVIETTAITSSQILLNSNYTNNRVAYLSAGSIIGNSSQTWDATSQARRLYQQPQFSTTVDPSNWPFNEDRFLGVRFLVGGNWFYGWVRISLPSISSFTIRDYAYNSAPNQPILAGETGTLGLNENHVASQISIFPNPASNQLTISLKSFQPEVEVSIVDITGKTVHKIKETETRKIEVYTTDFASGIYLVQIKATDFIETKKLIVKK